jgi:hypothetical protein
VYARRMRTRGVFQNGITAAVGWRSATAWLGVLALACGRPDDGKGSSLPPGLGETEEGPAPEPEAEPVVASGHALEPATDERCRDANWSAAADGGLRFDSELECRCSIERCPSTIEEAEQSLCGVASPPASVQRFSGCGLVVVFEYPGYEWTFQQPPESATSAPRLVGAARRSVASALDAGSPPSWWAGLDPGVCDYGPTSICQLCGNDPTKDYPPCE